MMNKQLLDTLQVQSRTRAELCPTKFVCSENIYHHVHMGKDTNYFIGTNGKLGGCLGRLLHSVAAEHDQDWGG